MNRTTLRRCAFLPCLLAALTFAFAGMTTAQADDGGKRVRLIYTNDTLGYLEPCGCGGRYLGGFARRSTTIASLLKAEPNVIVLDSGNLSTTADRIGITCKLMAAIKYEATGIGSLDSQNRDEFLKRTAACGLKVLDTTPGSQSTIPYLVKTIAGLRLGVISYGGNMPRGTSIPESFASAYKTARRESDVLVLLDQGGIATQQWLQSDSGGLGAPDIVIGGSARGVISTDKIIGKTHLAPTSQFGKYVGVADVELAADRTLKIASQEVLVDQNTEEDKEVAKQVDEFLEKPKSLATLSPSLLNFGSIKKGTKKEEYVTLTPRGFTGLTISKSTSTSPRVSAPDWTRQSDGSYKIRIVIDGGDTKGRVLETLSFTMSLPGDPTLNLRVFGNVVDE